MASTILTSAFKLYLTYWVKIYTDTVRNLISIWKKRRVSTKKPQPQMHGIVIYIEMSQS